VSYVKWSGWPAPRALNILWALKSVTAESQDPHEPSVPGALNLRAAQELQSYAVESQAPHEPSAAGFESISELLKSSNLLLLNLKLMGLIPQALNIRAQIWCCWVSSPRTSLCPRLWNLELKFAASWV
jgi:hypothetical protein